MKRILFSIAASALLLAACNSDKKESLDTDKNIVFSDTTGLKNSNATTDVSPAGQPAVVPDQTQVAPAPQPQVKTIVREKTVYRDRPQTQTTTVTPPVTEVPSSTGTVPATTGTTGTAGIPGTTPVPTEEEKKKGWSSAAKGATIGGVGGAAAGAIIGKGAKGAIIGGVVGAAGGYILGRKADKKSGRVDTTGN